MNSLGKPRNRSFVKITCTPAIVGLLVLMQLSGCAVVSLFDKPAPDSKTQTGQTATKPPMTSPAFPATHQSTLPAEVATHHPAAENRIETHPNKPSAHHPPAEFTHPVEPAPVYLPPVQAAPRISTEDVTQAVTQAQTIAEPKPETPTVTQTEPQAVTHPVTHAAPRITKETDTEIALAKPAVIETNSANRSHATDIAAYRKDAARHLYEHYAHRIYKGKLPPMLKGVGVVDVVIGPKGQVIEILWVRAPKQAPELSIEIENLIRIAGPFPAPLNLRKVTYTETWLWHVSGKFQLDTLTEGQQ